MSVTAIAWAWKQPIARNLLPELLALADNTNDVGVCWVRVSTLAAKTKTTERTVQRNLIALRDAGLLEVIERRLKGSGNRCNLYLLPLPGIDQKAQQDFIGEMTTGTLAKAKGDTSVTQGGVTPMSPRGDTHVTRIHKNETSLKGLNPTGADAPIAQEPKASKPKGDGKTLLPDDWTVPEKTRQKLITDGITEAKIDAQQELFKIYWSERTDSEGRKASWSMAFINWMKRADKEKAGPGEGPTDSHYKPNRSNYGTNGRKQSSAGLFGQLADRQQANQRRQQQQHEQDAIEGEYEHT